MENHHFDKKIKLVDLSVSILHYHKLYVVDIKQRKEVFR